MSKGAHLHLTRRERQIMNALYRRGSATASEVREELPDPPSYSAVRTLLARLVAKGHVVNEYDGPRYIYRPTLSRKTAQESALDQLVDTFFGGSPSSAAAALLDRASAELEKEELDQLAALIAAARRRGR